MNNITLHLMDDNSTLLTVGTENGLQSAFGELLGYILESLDKYPSKEFDKCNDRHSLIKWDILDALRHPTTKEEVLLFNTDVFSIVWHQKA